MKQRIWELDALRGVCILAMVVLHGLYDLNYYYALPLPVWIRTLMAHGGVVFLLLSGLCATLGRCSLRRGLQLLGCAAAITAVTLALGDRRLIIWFGVLHLLGCAMILWPAADRLSTKALALLGVGTVLLGYGLRSIPVNTPWFLALGLIPPDFVTGDYFPLLPHLGWFFLGACLGRTLYHEKRSRLPGQAPFLQWCGRHSLEIYLAHQPVLYLLMGRL